MKVLFAYRYGILGGVSTQLINRLSAIGAEEAIEAHLLFSEDFGIGKTLRDYPYLHFEKQPARIRSLARRHRFDAAVVIDTPEVVEALAPIVDLPIVNEVHTTLPQGLRYLRDRSWTTTGFIVPSEYLRQRLVREFGVGLTEPVEICPNSINPDFFPVVDLEVPPTQPVVCWVGKVDGHKNWRGFLRVAAEIKNRHSDVVFWMVGGITAPVAEESCLVREISDLGLSESLRWMPRIEYGAMHRVYAGVRMSGGVKLVTSVDESFGMSVLEALVCGCPVVAPQVGGLPEISSEGPMLRFYSPGDIGKAGQNVLEIVEGERTHEMVLAKRTDLLERFSTQTVVSEYFNVLRALLDGASEPAKGHQTILKSIDHLRDKLPRSDSREPSASATLEAANRVLATPPVRLYMRLRNLMNSSWPNRNASRGKRTDGT